ncbi:protein DpdG [Microvirga alba]|uniref:Uncharacterized protein n=1 Tax=Microvirga alba TaxID=2791025 RepID=A0A931FQX0_9HYPH|nr:protein DpdG [Microvirga alba]MBF9235117.1 hypothetical protein [Microvirga alba]
MVGATPNRLSALYCHLAEEGEEGQERTRLTSLVGPTSLARSEEAGEDNAFTDCLAVGSDLGLFVVDGDIIRLMSPPMGDKGDAFRAELAARLVDHVASATTPEGAVAGAIAWMLCQDPRAPLKWTGSASVMLRKQQFRPEVTADFGMTNDSRFQQAVYWARALGFVTRTNLGEELVIPDPTCAIEHRLDKLLPHGTEKLLSSFLAELADCCPVFEGGSVRTQVEDLLRPELRRESGNVSASTTLALHRLKQRGVIDLRRLDDGRVLFVEGLLDDGRVSHIRRG